MTLPTDIDSKLVDHAFFAGTEFHETFAQMRREDPVHWTDAPGYGRGFWSVTKYEDCLRLLQESENFSNTAGVHLPLSGRDLTAEEKEKLGYDVNIAYQDAPYHDDIRRPLNPHFSVPAVAKLGDDCNEIVDEIIDAVVAKGSADIVYDVAALLPARLFLTMMGIPVEDWPRVREITARMRYTEDPTLGVKDRSDLTKSEADAFGDLFDYVSSHVLARRGDPSDDFASLIANKTSKGRQYTDREASWLGSVVVSGGLETTRNAAAVGIMELIRRPEQAALLQDEAIAKSAVEEIIRWVTPSKNRLRVATRDIELGGKQIKAGDWLAGWIVSANRDEEAFGPTANEFDITRDPNPHLGFSEGRHICLGRNIVRLELRLLLPRLFQRIPDMKLTTEPSWIHSTNTTGVTSLPVSFTPQSTPVAA